MICNRALKITEAQTWSGFLERVIPEHSPTEEGMCQVLGQVPGRRKCSGNVTSVDWS